MIKRLILAVTLVALTAVPAFAQLPQSTTQMKLAVNADFLARVQYSMVQQARVVLTETGVGATHAARANYAKLVIQFPSEYAAKAATMLVGGVNLIGTVTYTAPVAAVVNAQGVITTPAVAESVVTSVSDAALLSQIATFWNQLASIDSGS